MSADAQTQFDVIVVGGGIVGVTHAYYLGLKGQRVALLERGSIGTGTTARNFSWINATSKISNEAYHRLNALGVEMYDVLAAEFGAEVIGLNATGALGLVSRSEIANYRALRADAEALTALRYPVEWLDRAGIDAMEPSLSLSDDAEGLLTPSDKSLDAKRFSRFLAERVTAQGGVVFENCAALELLTDDDGETTGILCETGTLTAQSIVIAAGPDTPDVLSALTGYDGFASRFPVNKVPGLLVTTPCLAKPILSSLVYTESGGEFHFFPDFNGGLRIASDVSDGLIVDDQTPENLENVALGLLARMETFLPGFTGGMSHREYVRACKLEIGVRAYPADGLSIAGALPGAVGLYVIATHSGITLAPALGHLMAELVVNGDVPAMLAPFELERLPGFEG